MKIKPEYAVYGGAVLITIIALLTVSDFYGILMFSACLLAAAAFILKPGA